MALLPAVQASTRMKDMLKQAIFPEAGSVSIERGPYDGILYTIEQLW